MSYVVEQGPLCRNCDHQQECHKDKGCVWSFFLLDAPYNNSTIGHWVLCRCRRYIKAASTKSKTVWSVGKMEEEMKKFSRRTAAQLPGLGDRVVFRHQSAAFLNHRNVCARRCSTRFTLPIVVVDEWIRNGRHKYWIRCMCGTILTVSSSAIDKAPSSATYCDWSLRHTDEVNYNLVLRKPKQGPKVSWWRLVLRFFLPDRPDWERA